MKSFHNILVVIEPRQLRQPALERGIALYNYAVAHKKANKTDDEVKIIAVLPVEKEPWSFTSLLSIDKKQLEKERYQKNVKWLDAYLSISAMGIKIDQKVIYSRNVGKELVSLAKDECCDILIKGSDIHGLLDSVFFTPLDWQILRNSPIPVCIAKDHIWEASDTIAVAVDLTSPDDEFTHLLNLSLLREAQALAKFTGCKIALINAITPIVPPVAVDVPGYTPDCVYDENVKESCQKALDFASRHKVSSANCHIEEGSLEDVIVDCCQKIKPTALFIGTAARQGIASAIIGNICERITDNLDCDVVVITPKSVIRHIPTTKPSKSIP